jgi:hypothetical protein
MVRQRLSAASQRGPRPAKVYKIAQKKLPVRPRLVDAAESGILQGAGDQRRTPALSSADPEGEFMEEPQRGSGTDEQRSCPGCGGQMYVSRRSPDLICPSDYVHHTFACHSCDVSMTQRIGKSSPSQIQQA